MEDKRRAKRSEKTTTEDIRIENRIGDKRKENMRTEDDRRERKTRQKKTWE
jgi:hypothetical protein